LKENPELAMLAAILSVSIYDTMSKLSIETQDKVFKSYKEQKEALKKLSKNRKSNKD